MNAGFRISPFFKREGLLLLLLSSPFVYMALLVFSNGIPDLPNSGDAALLELSTRNVFSRGILLGPYSRFPFYHPGPFYFQIRYPVYALFGERNSSLLVVTVLIQYFCLLFAWKAVKVATGGSLSVLFLASASMFLLSTDKSIWLSEWNPYIVILPFMLYVVSMAVFASGNLKYLAAAVVAGSLAAQTHISVIPSMAVIGVLAMLFAVYPWFISSKRSNPFYWKPVLIALGVLVLLWAAPLYQQFFPGESEGNITSIVNFFRETPPDVDSQRALAMWSSSLTSLELGQSDADDNFRNALIVFRLLLLTGSFIYLRKQGERPFLAASALFCIVLHGTSLFSVLQIRGAMNGYLVQWSGIVPVLSVFVLLGTLNDFLKPPGTVILKSLAGVFIVVSSVILPFRTSDFFRAEPHPSWEREIAVGELSRQLRQNLDWTGNDFFVISLVTTDQWPVMFGLLNSLEKMNLPVGVEDNLLYIPTRVPTGMTARTLHLGILSEQGLLMPGLAAEWNGTGLILQ